jgi:hypothetical protein
MATTDALQLYSRSVADHGLDAEKLEVLRGWGSGLQNDARAEVAAAGRAIMLLIEEIERLHVLLWDKQLYPEVPIPRPLESVAPAVDPGSRPSLLETLRKRLHRGSADTFPQAEPAAERDSTDNPQAPVAASPQHGGRMAAPDSTAT